MNAVQERVRRMRQIREWIKDSDQPKEYFLNLIVNYFGVTTKKADEYLTQLQYKPIQNGNTNNGEQRTLN